MDESAHLGADQRQGPDGKVTEYSIEGGSPNGLRRQGWSKDTMKPGDKIVMKMHPLKDGSPGGSFMSAMVNGVPLGREPGGGAPKAAPPARRPSNPVVTMGMPLAINSPADPAAHPAASGTTSRCTHASRVHHLAPARRSDLVLQGAE